MNILQLLMHFFIIFFKCLGLSEDNNEEKTVDSMTNSNSEELKTSTFFNIIRAIDELEIFLDDCNKKIVAARNLYTLNVETIMMYLSPKKITL